MQKSSDENKLDQKTTFYIISGISFLGLPLMITFLIIHGNISEKPHLLFFFVPVLLMFPAVGIGLLVDLKYGSKYENFIRLVYLILFELFVIGIGLMIIFESNEIINIIAFIMCLMLAVLLWIGYYPTIRKGMKKKMQ